VAHWLRHCATNRKVAGSLSDGVIGIFHLHKTSGRTMPLRSRVGLTTLPLPCADCLKSGSLNLLETSGTVKACNEIVLLLLEIGLATAKLN
jgi:hypothetical protein